MGEFFSKLPPILDNIHNTKTISPNSKLVYCMILLDDHRIAASFASGSIIIFDPDNDYNIDMILQ